MVRRLFAVVLAVVASVGLVLARPADAAPLRIGYSTWVGYGPLFLARDLGYFDQAHFARDFRSAVGRPPTAYAKPAEDQA